MTRKAARGAESLQGLAELERRLGHRFASPDLALQALTHRSFGTPHNERLEFLGDSLLNCAVATLLYERFPQLPEGDLSRLRAALGKLRESFVEERGDRAVQQRVAEELEPLVVRRAEAAVGEGLARELGLREGVSEAALQVGEVGDRRAARRLACHFAVVTEKSRHAEMLLTSGTLTDHVAESTASPPSLVISRSSL